MLIIALDRLGAALASLPWLVHVPVGLALIAGLVLWLAGRKVIRPVTITVGLAAGALLGFLLLPAFVPTIGISPYLGMVGGSVVGLLAALMLYRLATAVTFGSAVGAGCGMVAAALLGATLTLPAAMALQDPDTGLGGGEQPVYVPRKAAPPPSRWYPSPAELGPDPTDVETPATKPARKVVTRRPEPTPPPPVKTSKPVPAPQKKPPAQAQPRPQQFHQELPDDVVTPDLPSTSRGHEDAASSDESPAARVGTFWWIARDTWSEWWTHIPGKNKTWIIGASVIGLGIGTIIGLFAPAWAAGASTALVGSAVWLPSGLWLGKALNVPWVSTLSLSAGGWIVVWVVIALIGVAAQWYGLFPVPEGKRKKDSDDEIEAPKKPRKKK